MRLLWTPLLVASCAFAPAQNLLTNGDFELSVPHSGTANGWTAGINDGAGGWRSTGGNPGGTFILNSNGSPSSNPFIEQTVSSLIVGRTYQIDVDCQMAYFSSGGGANDFGIEADGHLWEFDVLNDSVWRRHTVTFVAASTTATVRFTAERYGDTNNRIDNAVLTEVVPEPASLVAMGLALMLMARRRRG